MKKDFKHLMIFLLAGGGEDEKGGAWLLTNRSPVLKVIASWGGGWDHVSVSTPLRTPDWYEMELVRDLFFEPFELVVQYSMPRDKNINMHQHCLHLWRPQDRWIHLPPDWMV